jgi:hypothetical protein
MEEDDDGLRTLNGGMMWDDDDCPEPVGVTAEDDQFIYEWDLNNVILIDWKDTRGAIKAVAKLAKQHPDGEVVDIQDGSDTYLFANTAAATIREK